MHIYFYSAVDVFFTEDDFRANEMPVTAPSPVPCTPSPCIPVVVTKNSRIANPIVLDVIPLTVEEANASMSGPPLPPNVPGFNPFSPPYAGNMFV